MFDRPIPIKSGVANPGGGGAKPGASGAKPGGGGWGKPTPKGNRFEKRTEFQDPATFSGQEVIDSWPLVAHVYYLWEDLCLFHTVMC